VADGRARARAIRIRMEATREPYTVAARRYDERRQAIAGGCSPCLEGAHAACTGRTAAFSGPCACQADEHRILTAEPLTEVELVVARGS
jgi:hypothetical protein